MVFDEQTVTSEAVTTGVGLTVTLTRSVLVQLFALVPVTVYEVVPTGGANAVPLVTPPVQEYVLAPVAASVMFTPWQTVWSTPPFTIGRGFTVTTTASVAVHPKGLVAVTVYVVVEDGFAVTLEPLVPLKPVAGDQVYEDPPVAVKVALPPAQ
jgi:hypothetical protein